MRKCSLSPELRNSVEPSVELDSDLVKKKGTSRELTHCSAAELRGLAGELEQGKQKGL